MLGRIRETPVYKASTNELESGAAEQQVRDRTRGEYKIINFWQKHFLD